MNHFPCAETGRSWHKFGEDALPGWYNHQTWRDDVRSMILQNWEKYKLSYFWNLYTIWYFTLCVCVCEIQSHYCNLGLWKQCFYLYWRREYDCTPVFHGQRENSMDRGACWATVHAVTRVGHNWATNTHTHICNFVHIFTCMIYTCQGVKQLVLECTNH